MSYRKILILCTVLFVISIEVKDLLKY